MPNSTEYTGNKLQIFHQVIKKVEGTLSHLTFYEIALIVSDIKISQGRMRKENRSPSLTQKLEWKDQQNVDNSKSQQSTSIPHWTYIKNEKII